MSRTVAQAVQQANIPALVINETHRLAPWADVLYAADSAWWAHRQDEALAFAGLKVTIDDCTPFPDVLLLKNSGREGFDADPSCLRTGNNSGYQAVHLAAHAGAARILLLGFDMRPGHWHAEHAAPLGTTNAATYERWTKRFESLATELANRNIDVVNCTPGSALACFRRSTLDKEI